MWICHLPTWGSVWCSGWRPSNAGLNRCACTATRCGAIAPAGGRYHPAVLAGRIRYGTWNPGLHPGLSPLAVLGPWGQTCPFDICARSTATRLRI